MVVKTDLCNFSEWKIYPGKGVRFVAKDGRPFLSCLRETETLVSGISYLIKKNQSPKIKMGNRMEKTS
jgi:ribosomal protein L24E